MGKRFLISLLFILLSAGRLECQDTGYGPGYQTIMLTNPAFAGSEGDGTLRLSYLNFYPGRNYNLHSFFASYDSFIPMLHGGAAAFISNDYMGGLINDMRGGLSYSYHLQAQKNIFINAGLSASFFHRGFDMGRMVFPDQIDPLGGAIYQSSEQMNIKGKTVFDVGAGFLMMAGKYTAGIAVNHLAKPDLSGNGITEEKIDREVAVHLSGLFRISTDHQIDLRPVIYGDIQGSKLIYGAGGVIETGFLAFNAMLLSNRAGDINIQTGIFLRSGVISFFYNYTFNISSRNNLLPASLVHQAGIVISLNNVDKRKIIKTINFPKC
jgi:type IX secretion system PorP/SprF family membrane protein